MNDRDADVEIRRLRGEMDVTRAKLSHTIGELEDRLKPRNVVSRATQTARDRAGRISAQVQEQVQAFGVGRSAAVAAGIASVLATWKVRRRRHHENYVTDGPVAQMIADQSRGRRRHSRTAVLLGVVALASTGAVLSRLRTTGQQHPPH